MRAIFKNPKSGELREVKVGWSWTLLFFSTIFAIPLFMRRLYTWAWIMLGIWVIHFTTMVLVTDASASATILAFTTIIDIVLSFFLAIKGNAMTAKNYLETGWVFADEQSEATQFAKGRWGIAR